MPARSLAVRVVVSALLLPCAFAQAAPVPKAPPPGEAPMLATERFLFVMRGDVLYQFDVTTLALLHSFDFARARPGRGAAPVATKPLVAAPEPPEVAVDRMVEPLSAVEVGTAVDEALRWLQRHQDSDGRWDADAFMKHDAASAGPSCTGPGNAVHDVGVTGLAMLAMLGSGSTLRSGPYKDALKLGVAWLRDQQQENGLFGTNASHDFIYDHAIASYAVCEAYGLSDYKALRHSAQLGIDYLESHRNPYSVWRYQPRDNDNDTSVTTWAAFALCSARSFGLETNANAFPLISTWYDQVTDERGRAGYTKRGELSSRKPGDHAIRFPVERGEAMTAAALCGRLLLGQTAADHPILERSGDLLLEKPPLWDADRIDALYWFFGTMGTYQLGGRWSAGWQPHLRALQLQQRHDGNFAGSWDPVGVWDEDGGRVYATALHALSLEVVARVQRLLRDDQARVR